MEFENLSDAQLLFRLALAVGLGLLVGLQRELVGDRLAGIRTYALMALAGAAAAMVDAWSGGHWVTPLGLLAVLGVMFAGNVVLDRTETEDRPGVTAEIAALVTYLAGAQIVLGSPWIGVVIGATVAVLLHFKNGMHDLIDRLTDTDVRAVMQFVLISLIVLPLVPNEDFGPYDAFNPYETWLMVVLIVGINLAGYIAYRVVGDRGGAILSGIIGGLVSSTAATASFARQSSRQIGHGLAALAIMLASTVLVARVLVELGVVARSTLGTTAPPIIAMLVANVVICLAAFFFINRDRQGERPEPENPAQLKAALIFAALYAIIKLAVAFAQDRFGDSALYAVAVISGLTDVDAITLSTGRLSAEGSLDAATAWRVIMVAALANLAFKAGIAASLGGWKLFRIVAVMFGASLAVGLGIIFFWPG